MRRRIGFIGLGMMGLPMLENLAATPDLEILAFDTADAPFQKLAALAAWDKSLFRANTLHALAGCEIVITMLPNSPITNGVIEGGQDAAGLADILAPGAVIVDMGSSDPGDTVRLAAMLSERGMALVDAPVSGAVAKARAGTLAIMAGGDAAHIDAVRPLLEQMGETLIVTGAVGSAHAMKALNNYIYAAGLLAVSEAMLIASRLDLDADVFASVLNASSGRNVATETKLAQFIIPRTFNAGFAMRLQAKDLMTAAGLQPLAGVDLPQLSLCAALWQRAVETLDARADNTEIIRYLEALQETRSA
ncbi:3-hydroxyisobutyrate dehydrogenase [Cupriavidus gilardii J11]|uniref:3-hydroxyisobutyrate dehydrogenase n=1 Tax=Cupriavidus gilardii J11 TaxID=936133 RepID=A0A562BK57_9BURK|nr:NAD(P)-dependent oxidoreductase [Cupriavidus gilardii]TWG85638.1 3-hydroxyisobutyrate dehydrogenase [Cupriavidus gilardii J11]